MERSSRVTLTSTVVFLTTSCLAWADPLATENLPLPGDHPPEEVPAVMAESPESPRLSFMDRRMATCLAIDAQTGVDLANWAVVHSHDPRVKQFAQSVAVDSMAFLRTLDEHTDGKATAALRNNAEQDADASTPRRPPGKLSVLNAERVLMRMKCEIAEESSEFLRAQLEGCSADSVDVTYVGGEVFRQVQMLSTLKVLHKYGSKGFEPLLKEAIKMTQRHLAETLAMLHNVNGPSNPDQAAATPAVAHGN
jgi:hypothetical protein